MKRRGISNCLPMWLVLIPVLALLIWAGCGKSAAPTAQPKPPTVQPTATATKPATPTKISWKLFSYLPGTHVYVSEVLKPFADEVRQQTEGQLDITVYSAGELPYKGTELLSALKNRELEIAQAGPPFAQGELPVLGMWTYPWINAGWEEWRAMKDVLMPPSREAVRAKFNTDLLILGNYPPLHLFATKPIPTVADMKGVRFRVLGPDWGEFLNGLGATGITVTPGEVYTALERGTIEGIACTSYLTQYTSKWHEVANHVTEWNTTVSAEFVWVNLDALNALPAGVRGKLESLATKYEGVWLDVLNSWEVKAKEAMVSAGAQVYTLSETDKRAMVDIAKPLWDKWAQKYEGGTDLLEKVLQAVADAS